MLFHVKNSQCIFCVIKHTIFVTKNNKKKTEVFQKWKKRTSANSKRKQTEWKFQRLREALDRFKIRGC